MNGVEAETAEATLAEVHRLRLRAAGRAHGGAWLPALAIAVLLLGSIVLYADPFNHVSTIVSDYPYWAGLPDNQRDPTLSYVYWFVGTPLVFGGIAAWYRWRAARTGMRVAWWYPVGIGLAVLVLLAVIAAVPSEPRTPVWSGIDWSGLVTPLIPIALAVISLGVVERSTGMVAAGAWMLVLTGWQVTSGGILGFFPGGQLTLLGVHRPGFNVLLMAVPLLLVATVRLARTRTTA